MMAAATTDAPAAPIEGQTEIVFADGPIGRAEKRAHERDLQVEELEEAGDTEGADIARVEADQARQEVASLKEKLGDEPPAETGKAEELKDEAGESTGAMPPAAPNDSELLPEDIVVAGLKIEAADLGGKKATSATLDLTGMKARLAAGTFLRKGNVVHFTGTAIVNDVGGKDIHDSTTGQVTDAVQRHKARVVKLEIEIPGGEK